MPVQWILRSAGSVFNPLPLRRHYVSPDLACNLLELLATLIGGPGQIETAESHLARQD